MNKVCLAIVMLLFCISIDLVVGQLCSSAQLLIENETCFEIKRSSELKWPDIEREMTCCHLLSTTGKCDGRKNCANVLRNEFNAQIRRIRMFSHLLLPNLIVSMLLCLIIISIYPMYSLAGHISHRKRFNPGQTVTENT